MTTTTTTGVDQFKILQKLTFNPKSNGATEMLHKNFRFLDFRGEHLTSNHRTERNLSRGISKIKYL